MKIIFSDTKKQLFKVRITSPEDSWYLSQIIEPGDGISGKTVRKITIGSEDTRTSHSQRTVYLKIAVEKVELGGDGTVLRIGGKVTEGPEEVSRGSYHTFNLGENDEVSIEKPEWLSHHKTYLKDAAEATHTKILICVFDRDEAILAISKQQGYEILAKLRSDSEKKEKRAITKTSFYPEIVSLILKYDVRHAPKNIILASPAFYKEDLAELFEGDIRKKLVLATCSSAVESAIDEVFKRPETRNALQKVRVAHETGLVEELLVEISRSGPATYGISEVKKAADSGAVKELLLTTELLQRYRINGSISELNTLIKSIDNTRGSVHIISIDHEAGKKLRGLGGIAALLRYKSDW